MPEVTITALFREVQSARAAVPILEACGVPKGDISIHLEEVTPLLAQREAGFMTRLVLMVVLWSVVGTAAGAALGALLSYTFGPHGTEGLILQAVSWAIFAHLLIGMWAGYILLADRAQRDVVPGASGRLEVRANAAAAEETAEALRRAGATDVRQTEVTKSVSGHKA